MLYVLPQLDLFANVPVLRGIPRATGQMDRRSRKMPSFAAPSADTATRSVQVEFVVTDLILQATYTARSPCLLALKNEYRTAANFAVPAILNHSHPVDS